MFDPRIVRAETTISEQRRATTREIAKKTCTGARSQILKAMKYLKYLSIAALIDGAILLLVLLFSSLEKAVPASVIAFPSALWTARLIVAWHSGLITRRFKMLDGGLTFKGAFWSFFPDVYERRSGFDNFKGYFVKEALLCGLVWLMFVVIPVYGIIVDK